ncbi:MAG TPA: TetR/AcrR family transcriptional regulator [Actinomycetes bacterium]|jgi:AcrR family transcriptional regulator|nr:TetR/AcrR family transcriptional regulator [Actinomycetes bacterium]
MVLSKPRDRILSTATTLFYREGVLAVGVNRIIAEADVAPMTLYRQFGSKDELVASTLEQWSTQWLHWLADKLDRSGDDPEARFAALWDVLEEWFAADDFHGSFVTNAAAELRSEPEHPGHKVIAAHRQAMRQLLEDLAKAASAYDAAILAAQLQVLIDGAVATATVDRRPGAARSARQLANAALVASSS